MADPNDLPLQLALPSGNNDVMLFFHALFDLFRAGSGKGCDRIGQKILIRVKGKAELSGLLPEISCQPAVPGKKRFPAPLP